MGYDQEFIPASGASYAQPPIPASAALAPLTEGLRALNAQVSEEFMALAAALQSNSARARQITAQSRKATGAEANLQSATSIALLQRILAESAGINEMVETSTAQMLEILSHVNATHRPLQTLSKTRVRLKTIGVLSRIESERITNGLVDLSSLSRDIDVMGDQVQQHLEQFGAESSRLHDVLQHGLLQLNKAEQQERVQQADLIRRTQSVLEPMVSRAEASHAAAHEIDVQYTDFRRATDKIVMSLQAEDIARQRMEHIQEAIRQVAASLDTGASVQSGARILALQRSQLAGTRDLLAESIQTIQSALQPLSPQITELVSRTANLAEQTDENGRSFASVIDEGLDTVSSVFERCSESVKAVLAIVNSVVPQMEEMTRGACALEMIESSIQLISLNAAIKTSQLGSEGAAMGVIAAELLSVTKGSEGDTKIVLDALAAIHLSLEKITHDGAGAANSLMMTSSSQAVRNELQALSQAIRDSSQEMSTGLSQVQQIAAGLCPELELSCRLALRAASLLPSFDEQLQNLDDALTQMGCTGPMLDASDGGSQADDLSRMYSMESERKIHMAVLGGDANLAATPESSEFGDDVELF
jgi:di/tripeptidase